MFYNSFYQHYNKDNPANTFHFYRNKNFLYLCQVWFYEPDKTLISGEITDIFKFIFDSRKILLLAKTSFQAVKKLNEKIMNITVIGIRVAI